MHKKYTLKNRTMPTLKPKFLREYFFSHPRRIFSHPAFFKNLSPQPHGLSRKPTMTATNVNRFVDKFLLTSDSDDFGRERRASGNKGLAEMAGEVVKQTVCYYLTLVLGDSKVLRMPPHRQAPER